jgi:hypothetical protein
MPTPSQTETAWLAFKAKHDNPTLPPCPFCGIRHVVGKAHPFCDMATVFKFSVGDNT